MAQVRAPGAAADQPQELVSVPRQHRGGAFRSWDGGIDAAPDAREAALACAGAAAGVPPATSRSARPAAPTRSLRAAENRAAVLVRGRHNGALRARRTGTWVCVDCARMQGSWEPRAVPRPFAEFHVDPRRPWRLPAGRGRTWRSARWQARMWFGAQVQGLAERISGLHFVGVNFAPSVELRPRYGFGKPAHPQLLELFERSRNDFAAALDVIGQYADALLTFPVQPAGDTEPAWEQSWLPPLDGAALYAFVRDGAPKRFVEVGSGWSTRFVARAIRDGELSTELISIDPEPRAEIDALCNRVLRCGLEIADLDVFETLEPGDIVFIDNSHRSFTNSDVTVFFLDVLPRIPGGVLVGIHDVTLPADYPPGWNGYYFNEQYLLACYLLAGTSWLRPELAAMYASSDVMMAKQPQVLVDGLTKMGVHWFGSGFWFRIVRG